MRFTRPAKRSHAGGGDGGERGGGDGAGLTTSYTKGSPLGNTGAPIARDRLPSTTSACSRSTYPSEILLASFRKTLALNAPNSSCASCSKWRRRDPAQACCVDVKYSAFHKARVYRGTGSPTLVNSANSHSEETLSSSAVACSSVHCCVLPLTCTLSWMRSAHDCPGARGGGSGGGGSEGGSVGGDGGAVVGDVDGAPDGDSDGVLVGANEGVELGPADGASEGDEEGTVEGVLEGTADGKVEGVGDGADDGASEGDEEGTAEGVLEGTADGKAEGVGDGADDGAVEGRTDGVVDG